MINKVIGACFIVLISCGISLAAHPLITDDAGTQGKGKFQFELNYQHDREDSGGTTEYVHQVQTTLTYGIIDKLDFVLNMPYQFITTKAGGEKVTEKGLSDMSIDLKWQFFEMEHLSFAIKPGISIPSGDSEKGLGAGKVGGRLFFIATGELEPWTFHLNLGYGRNENDVDERTDIWHVSLASELEVCPWLKAVANIGAERSPDKASDTPAVFLLGGLIFPVTDSFEVDMGVKGGLTEPESDYALLAGMTFRF